MIIFGNIGSNVEKKTSKNDKPYVEFRLAENHGKEENRTTTWFTVRAFIDELSADLLGKGMFVRIEGRLLADAYNKKDGGLGVGLTVMAYKCEPAERKNPPSQSADEPRQSAPQGGRPEHAFPEMDDDIPF